MSNSTELMFKCIDCENKCSEYNSNFVSDKAYYEWSKKAEMCEDYLRRDDNESSSIY